MQKGGGLITASDLASYEVKEREPIRGTYRGYDVISAPPPSSGGIALLEILNILEGYDLAKFGNRSADAIHLTTEAFRRAFFDRAEFLGDPDFAKIPVAQLIDKRYAEGWRESIDPPTPARAKICAAPPSSTNSNATLPLIPCCPRPSKNRVTPRTTPSSIPREMPWPSPPR